MNRIRVSKIKAEVLLAVDAMFAQSFAAGQSREMRTVSGTYAGVEAD